MSRDLNLEEEPWIVPHANRDLFDPVEEVTVISPEAAAARPDVAPPERRYRSGTDPAAEPVAMLRHVVTADELHQQRISALTSAIQAAVDFLSLPKTGAKAWARDLSYHERLTNPKGNGLLDKAVDECRTALDFIAVQEDE